MAEAAPATADAPSPPPARIGGSEEGAPAAEATGRARRSSFSGKGADPAWAACVKRCVLTEKLGGAELKFVHQAARLLHAVEGDVLYTQGEGSQGFFIWYGEYSGHAKADWANLGAVSYTHLTLPTILLV